MFLDVFVIDTSFSMQDVFLRNKYKDLYMVEYISRLYGICKSLFLFINENDNSISIDKFYLSDMELYRFIVEHYYSNKSYLIIEDLINNSDDVLFNIYYSIIINEAVDVVEFIK